MSESAEIDAWLGRGEYLPRPMRDFHDAKDLFKTIHARVKMSEYTAKIDWVAGQCYVIDIFLWFMARRGYTLQRSRKKLPFGNLGADINESISQRNKQMAKAIGLTP